MVKHRLSCGLNGPPADRQRSRRSRGSRTLSRARCVRHTPPHPLIAFVARQPRSPDGVLSEPPENILLPYGASGPVACAAAGATSPPGSWTKGRPGAATYTGATSGRTTRILAGRAAPGDGRRGGSGHPPAAQSPSQRTRLFPTLSLHAGLATPFTVPSARTRVLRARQISSSLSPREARSAGAPLGRGDRLSY